jgi:predicted aconitase with swiveling domain
MSATILFPGEATGRLLLLEAPLSFWGMIDPETGKVTNPRHPQYGCSIAGTILVMPEPIGSSTSSAVLLELIRNGKAPAGIVLGRPDAILVVGCLVARELGWPAPPVVVGSAEASMKQGALVCLDAQGRGNRAHLQCCPVRP